MHSILEKYFRGVISIPEMRELYDTDYDSQVTAPFPPNKYVDLAESYKADGQKFLD